MISWPMQTEETNKPIYDRNTPNCYFKGTRAARNPYATAEVGLVMATLYGGFPKLGVPSWVPIIRIIVFWGLYGGPLILGNYHI